MQSTLLQRSILCFALCLPFAQAHATEIFDSTPVTSNVINFSAVRVDATIFSTGGESAPFLINTYAAAGECLRLDVTVQPGDMEMVVVAPDGTVYRNDDRPGSLLPLVQIARAPDTGWYTVHLSRFSGSPLEGDLAFLYGRYTAGSANCGQATPPLSIQAASISAMFEEENATAMKKQAEGTNPILKQSTEPKPR